MSTESSDFEAAWDALTSALNAHAMAGGRAYSAILLDREGVDYLMSRVGKRTKVRKAVEDAAMKIGEREQGYGVVTLELKA